MKKAKFGN